VTGIIEDLQWRGLIALSTDIGALAEALDAGPVTYYCGFDPTAPSLHIGNLVQILTLRRLQQAGHRPLALVGGATGLIGDPKPTSERVLQDRDVVAARVERVRRQIEPMLDFSGANAAVLVNNLDWTAPMTAIDFLRDIGKHFRVNKMIAKEAVSARLHSRRASTSPSSATRSSRPTTSSSCTGGTAACCRPVAATSGATSPPASTWSTGWRAPRCTPSRPRW
jgi:tyrosyl-tRNA synthetase